ncbi:MAG: U32 family peptidase [Victivallales bacterium]|nr:U32 family peptidase [Victivallales bacterium]
MSDITLLSPAGSFESLQAALDNGADAIYFGVGELNMRSRATVNFTEEDLPEIVKRCHKRKVQAWLALNIIVYDNELPEITRLCQAAKAAGIDAVIALDISVITAARKVGLPVHISVQANISNIEAVRFYAQFADVVVLARELNLEQISQICQRIQEENIIGPSGKLMQVEIFAHGALCVAISGKCYMSLATYGTSGNRGACFQPCRRKYTVRDTETDAEFVVDNQYVMSPKDLCTIGFLDKILDSGISVLKLEGRGRSADYVARVTAVYKEAIQHWEKGLPFTNELIEEWEQKLAQVFNRGFWKGGYYLGKKLGEWAAARDSQATVRKDFAGTVTNYFAKPKIAEAILNANGISVGDKLWIIGNKTGAVEYIIPSLRANEIEAQQAQKGDVITFPCDIKLRAGDKIYKEIN